MNSIIEFDKDWKPLNWQKKVWNQKQRFKVVRVGRRAGKTEFGTRWLVHHALHTGEDGLLIAPTDGLLRDLHLKKYFLPLLKPLIDNKLCEANISKGNISFTFSERFKGGTILLRGAENVDKRIIGMGKGLTKVWLDEVSRMKDPKYLFSEILQPMSFDHDIRFLFTSTPHGFDFFKELSERANNPTMRHYWEYHGPSYINPNVSREEIDNIIENEGWTVVEIAENIYADFDDMSTGVFGNYRRIYENYDNPPVHEGNTYVVGVDIATVGEDWTVIYVLNLSSKPAQLVHKERIQKIDPVKLEELIISISKKYNNAKTFTDYTNEKNLTDRLKKAIRVEGINFTVKSKPEMIHNMAYLIEKEAFVINCKDLMNEMAVYRAEKTPHGNIKYNAPSGYHDDCISALMLLLYGVKNKFRPNKVVAPSMGNEYRPYSPQKFGDMQGFYGKKK